MTPPGPGPSACPDASAGNSGDRTAAAISVSGIPVAADNSASWLAASAEDRPSRSMSAPLAIATTDSPAAAARMRSSVRRWSSMTAMSRRTSSSPTVTITRLPAR